MPAPPPRHFPFLAGHDPLRMGVAAIEEAAWFELDECYAAQMAEKERLLAQRRADVLQALPAAGAAAHELQAAIAAWVTAHRRDFVRQNGVVRCPDGRRVTLAGTEPLATAARLVQEDLCLLEAGAGERLHLTGACLCFPSRWRLGEKLGHPMLDIHAPVPGLNPKLGATIDRFLSGLKSGVIYTRTNWSLTTDPALFQPEARPHAPVTPETAGERVFYRVERQTLRRLADSGAVVFGIRVHQHSLAAFSALPAMRRALADAVAGLDPSLIAYKSMGGIRDAVIEYLHAPR
jgi:hypothetical protein